VCERVLDETWTYKVQVLQTTAVNGGGGGCSLGVEVGAVCVGCFELCQALSAIETSRGAWTLQRTRAERVSYLPVGMD
jgi:hypothetical protein